MKLYHPKNVQLDNMNSSSFSQDENSHSKSAIYVKLNNLKAFPRSNIFDGSSPLFNHFRDKWDIRNSLSAEFYDHTDSGTLKVSILYEECRAIVANKKYE